MMNLILFGSMIWIPALIAYMLINETKFKKNIVIGVTLPKEAREDEKVLAILDTFKKQELLICGVLMALGVLCMIFVKKFSMTVFMIWTLMCVGAPYIPYVLTNIRLKEYKEEKGWAAERRTVYADTAAQMNVHPLSSWLFLPPCFISLIPLLWDQQTWFLYMLFSVLCALFWLSCRWLYRNKPEMVDENTDVTNTLSRMRRYNWSKMWLVCSWLMALMALCAGIDVKWSPWGVITALVLTVFLTVYAVRIEMKTRAVQEKLTKNSGEDWYVDEDDRWLWGLLYYNPDDSRTIINNRVGLNSTVNLARPAGKVLIGLAALLLAALPFLGIFFDQIDTKPIKMTADAQALEISSGFTDYKVSIAEIDSLELRQKPLSSLSRRSGTGMEHTLKGHFTSSETGNVTVLLDPTNEPFILIQTRDGKYWFFGTRDSETTKQVYEQLKQYTGQ